MNDTLTPQITATEPLIDLHMLLDILRRRAGLIALCAAAGLVAGLVYCFFIATPQYRSTAVVILDTNQKSFIEIQTVVPGLTGDASEVTSQAEVLRSRGLLGQVVDVLALDTDPEFNPALRAPSTLQKVKAALKRTLRDPAPPASPDAALLRERTITRLRQRISIRNVPSSLVFQITAQSTQPQKSALIAQTLAERYILDQKQVKYDATEQASLWLTQRVDELQAQLETSEARLARFNAATALISPEALQAQEIQLKDLRSRTLEASDRVSEAIAYTMSLQMARDRPTQAARAQDPFLDRLLVRLAQDPQAQEVFDTRFGDLLSRAERTQARAYSQHAALEASAAALSERIEAQNQDLITLQQYRREADAVGLLYEHFLTRLQETAAQQGIQQADSRILSDAVVPRGASSPREAVIVPLMLALGTLVGVVLALAQALLRPGFQSAQDLQQATGRAVLGQIPNLQLDHLAGLPRYLIENTTTPETDAFRSLRTSVLQEQAQVIVSGSCLPDEGKTTNSIALAHHIASLGRRLLLIDADLRRQSLSHAFAAQGPGLAEMLEGCCDNAIQNRDDFSADLLSAGTPRQNPADLLCSQRFASLLGQWRNSYDTILIDTPPFLVVPDGRIVAGVSDLLMFCVQWNATSAAQIQTALEGLEDAAPHVGLILSRVEPQQMARRYGAKALARYYAAVRA